MLDVVGGWVQRRCQSDGAAFEEEAAPFAMMCVPNINSHPPPVPYKGSGSSEIADRNAETAREVVARAGRNNAQIRPAAHESERDVFDCTIAAGNDYDLFTGAGGAAR